MTLSISERSNSFSTFLCQRLEGVLPAPAAERLRHYMISLFRAVEKPPLRVGGPDWVKISKACRIDIHFLRGAHTELTPLFSLLVREVAEVLQNPRPAKKSSRQKMSVGEAASQKKPGPPPREVVEFPEPSSTTWIEPAAFHESLDLHMRRHGDTYWGLVRAVVRSGEALNVKTISSWQLGTKSPRSVLSFRILGRIEHRYRLPQGYFKAKLPHPSRAAVGHPISYIAPAERRRIAWHLPDDFDSRSREERDEIIRWIRTVVVSGATEYRRYQAKAMKQRYAVRFNAQSHETVTDVYVSQMLDADTGLTVDDEGEVLTKVIQAPSALSREMASLLEFKTSILTAAGFQRVGVWGEATTQQKTEHLGLMFGALVASPKSIVRGFGVHPERLAFGLLVFPAVWDWYLNWREKRRGFYTAWEMDMLRVASALTRDETGWMRQTPVLSERLMPIKGLVSTKDIKLAQRDWAVACDIMHKHANIRAKELQRVARVHRDPFEPILPILEADHPLAEYKKIADEVRRLMPDEGRFPTATAEAVRSYLMLRIGMHLGVRQKNLRQLLVSKRGEAHRAERALTDRLCGEMRWSDKEAGWEVFIPAAAFKNGTSSYFGNRPFRLLLPDLGDLYSFIDAYLGRHRAVLLRNSRDPETFFVKTVKTSSKDAAYNQTTFYEAWRLIIQRHGIFNPYTGRGAIKGLLPHGPHSIRDVLATHILKRTGSYEQASYAIQDTPDMVAKHYGRFLPKDKAAIAAQVLNRVWETA